MLIDSHQHVFWHGRDDAGLIADMDEHGIDLAWLLTWEIPPQDDDVIYHRVLNPAHVRPDGTHGGIPLSDLILARDRYPDRFVLGYCPYPAHPAAADLFEAAYNMHHVRVCGEWKFRIPFDDPRCLELFRRAGKLRCPVVLHLDVPYLVHAETKQPQFQPRWYGGTVLNLERALQACPDTIFIGHAPGFWREISGDADCDSMTYPTAPIVPGGRLDGLLEHYSNLYADLSAGSALGALKRDPCYACEFLTRWNGRLLFARDYYGGDLSSFLSSLNLGQGVRDNICFRNAQNLMPDVSLRRSSVDAAERSYAADLSVNVVREQSH